MERMIRNVKARRPYDSRHRHEQANRTRRQILDVAGRRFLADGYAETTIAAIAEVAEVSVETIYKAFGGKSGLVRAIWEGALEGAGTVPAEQRSDAMQVSQLDPRQVIRNWAQLMTEVSPRAAPIVLLIRGAAGSDPRMAELLAEVNQQRLERMERNARTLFDRGDLRPGVTLDQARDVMWTFTAPELFELLVLRRRWSVEQFAGFIADQLIAALLPPGEPTREDS